MYDDTGNVPTFIAAYCPSQGFKNPFKRIDSDDKGNFLAGTMHTKPIIAVYIPNDGSENVCIAKYDPGTENRIQKDVDYESLIVLPRLSLGYYLILAVAALVALVIVWFLTQKKATLRIWNWQKQAIH